MNQAGKRRRLQGSAVLCVSIIVSLVTMATSAAAKTGVTSDLDMSTGLTNQSTSGGVIPQQRIRVLGVGWRSSHDRSWALTSGSSGVGIMVASTASGLKWRPLVSLRVAGINSRQWIGQACVVPRSNELAVSYGPVEYISLSRQFETGAFAALVDLSDGRVRALPFRSTFSYFSPSCGGRTATFTRFGTDEMTTDATSINATGRRLGSITNAPGEITGLVRTSTNSYVGASGSKIVRITSAGHVNSLTTQAGAAYALRTETDGAIDYLTDTTKRTLVHQLRLGRDQVVAEASRGDVALTTLQTGRVIAHGATLHARAHNPITISHAAASATPSLEGRTFTRVIGTPGADNVRSQAISNDGASAPTPVSAAAASPAAAHVAQPAKLVRKSKAAADLGSSTADANLPCAVQRTDVNTEAYQPSPAQVEWSVDRAVVGTLKTARAAGYRGYGLGSYNAQGIEPLPTMSGGGNVPPQIMLGILANESNLWQASSHVTEGGYGEPLTGNIYGRTFDNDGNESLTIDFSHADCGYGISQVTDGMRKGEQSASTQRAIALDYQVNIAAGLRILVSKWNQLKSLGIVMNNGAPNAIENWYAAAWAYNSGLQPNSDNGNTTGCSPSPSCTDGDGRWGLGWANNPSNPIYPPNRHMFNSQGADAATPSQWPYQERVIGWAAYPIYEPDGSYSQAYWTSDQNRVTAIPDPRLFCTNANDCDPGVTAGSTGHCQLPNLHCWLHDIDIQWHDCSSDGAECGFGQAAYSTSAAEPPDPISEDPSDCAATLGSSAKIVDDVLSSGPSPAAPCHSLATFGSFAFTFTADSNGNYPAHIDLHQINGGTNGHYWFTHSTQTNDNTAITGTWTFPTTVTGWGRLMVHVPALGAQTNQGRYTITDGSSGQTQPRVVNQGWGSNHWLSLGDIDFTAGEKVSLSSYSPYDDGSDTAWDSVAFVPVTAPKYRIVGLGDSYSAGEGIAPYDADSDNSSNACHRSEQGFPRLLSLPGSSTALASDTKNELDFLACSGAHTTSVARNAVISGSEVPPGSKWDAPFYDSGEDMQVEQGYLDNRTDAVTISIGGNDARFADVLKSCSLISPTNNCSQDGYTMKGDPEPLADYESRVITDLLPAHLTATFEAIHAAAPTAQIYVVGYPHIFPPTGSTAGACGLNAVHQPDQVWVNKETDLLATAEQNVIGALAASGIGIYYVDTRTAFAGHDACSDNPWMNALVAHSSSGSGSSTPGSGSYHPQASGQAEFAKLVSASMADHLPLK